MMKPILFLVDDSEMLVDFLSFFYKENFDVLSFNNSVDAFRFLNSNEVKIDAALIDLHMPGLDGVEIIKHFMDKNPTAEVSIMTGDVQHPIIPEVKRQFKVDVLPKPFELNMLISFAERVVVCA